MPSPATSSLPRRQFLHQLPLATGAISSLLMSASPSASPTPSKPIRFGLISDVHQDIMHDGVERVSAFIEAMTTAQAEFIVQLGDFCRPLDTNQAFLQAWNRFPRPRHHVLGNHDMDGGAPREQTVAFYGMPSRFHSFLHRGLKFLVLDGNDPGGSAPGYRRFLAADQLEWLAAEVTRGSEPVLIFIHQALDHPSGIENQMKARAILESARYPDGSPRVMAVFSGHHHQDWLQTIHGIRYLQINSASYHWVGDTYAHDSYPEAVLRDHPWIRRTCPYRDPLWAQITIDPIRGILEVEGRSSQWVGPSPSDLGIPISQCPPETTVPAIRHRQWPWPMGNPNPPSV